MQNWQANNMCNAGKKLFASVHKRKRQANHNHEVHFLAREINEWLPNGIESLKNGTYDSRPLKRYYFKDEMVDQLHITDRILQNILLKQLKPTFKHIINPNCLHMHGPTGVKIATDKIKKALAKDDYHYIIRADIKSYYKSIQHHVLIKDVRTYFDDPKVQTMLINIIKNPIDTPWGMKNPDNGIALRGPLSQLFGALYLKPLDDAFNGSDVTYVRYQDDIVILCKTKRQMNRCRKKMMDVLHSRHLTLSRKKSRMGLIKNGFHFLGVDYPKTQTSDITNTTPRSKDVCNKNTWGGVEIFCLTPERFATPGNKYG